MSNNRLSEISAVGRSAVVHLTSFLPVASIVKNTMTLYTLCVALFIMAIAFPLFYINNGLFALLTNLGNLQQPLFVYGVAYFIFESYTVYYPSVSEEMNWSEDKLLRQQFLQPVCMIFTILMMLYVKGDQVGLWHSVVCELMSRQILTAIGLILDVYYVNMNGPSHSSFSIYHSSSGRLDVSKIIFRYFLTVFITLLTSFIEIIVLTVAIIPLSLSFLNLTEIEKLAIYGIAYPILRYFVGHLMNYSVSIMEKGGYYKGKPQSLTNVRFTIGFGTALFFSTSPVFCMLFLSSDPLSFAITYIPHTFFSKLMWVRHIPQVKALFVGIYNGLGGVICYGRQSVLVQQTNQTETITDNVLSEQDRIRIGEEEMRKKEEESLYISNNAAILEVSDLVGTKIAIISMVMRLCFLCFFPNGSSSSEISFDQFKVLLINVFCVILPIDQISAILGFALLAQNGHPVDSNFHLDINILNPIRTWRNGHRFKAIGSLSYCFSTFLSLCCAIAIGTYGPLF